MWEIVVSATSLIGEGGAAVEDDVALGGRGGREEDTANADVDDNMDISADLSQVEWLEPDDSLFPPPPPLALAAEASDDDTFCELIIPCLVMLSTG